MKERILTGWTFQRAIYLLVGLFIIIHSSINQQWFGTFIGFYFFSMGLLAFGCASGSCYSGTYQKGDLRSNKSQEVEFEEVK